MTGPSDSRHRWARPAERLRSLELTLAEQARQLSATTAQRDELQARLTEKDGEVQELSQRLTALERRLHEEGTEADRTWQRYLKFEAELHRMHSSRAWRVLQLLYRMRSFLFPPGSQRERLYTWSIDRQRRRRHRVTPAGTVSPRQETPPGSAPESLTVIGRSVPERDDVQLPADSLIFSGEEPGLVTVVLPVFNQARLLRESIDSVLSQTRRQLELIVVDDGSADGVESVLEEYLGDARVRLLTQPNQGLPKALSNGFEFARGEFWTWTSTDNIMEPAQLERQVAFLRANPGVAMVYADYLAIGERVTTLHDPTSRPHIRHQPGPPEVHLPRVTSTLNARPDNFIGPCFMYRGWVGRILGEYAPNLGLEDYDYWMRLNALFELRHLGTDELLSRYRVHEHTLNAQASQLGIAERKRRLMKYDAERRAYYRRPWRVYVDNASRERLAGVETTPHSVRRLSEYAPADGRTSKSLVLSGAETLASRDPTRGDFLAVFFEESAETVYRASSKIRHVADVCFASARRTVEQLGLFTPNAFGVCGGAALFSAVLALANNATFYRETTRAEQRGRSLPRAFRPRASRLRVLLQVEHLLQGGLERVVLDLAEVLDKQRFEVAILALGRWGPAARQARRLGLSLLEMPAGPREAAYLQLLRANRIDLVNAHYSHFGASLAAEVRIPFIQTIHNSYVWLSGEQLADLQSADAHTQAYICVSATAALYSARRLRVPVEKLLVVPNGIDLAKIDAARAAVDRTSARASLGLGPDDFVFLNMASILPAKAQICQVRALARVLRRLPGVKLILLGAVIDEHYHQELVREIDRLRLADCVRLLGYSEEPEKFYCLSEAFLLPSLWEGWSLALTEAICAGLPAIATDVGGARDLLEAAGGRLLPPPYGSVTDLTERTLSQVLGGDHTRFVADLAEAMEEVATAPEAPHLSEELRRTMDRRHAYLAYERLYEWIAGGGRAAAARPWTWQSPPATHHTS